MESPEKYSTSTFRQSPGKHPAKPISHKGHGVFKDKDMQQIIGWILRAGVIASMAIVFIGGILYVYRHGSSIADYHIFKPASYSIRILGNNNTISGQAIIELGIILLIATPIVRVAFSAIGFIIEKDHLYTAITLIVLLIIVCSMLSGYAG
jgi:uncharacterized membrane protein